MKPHTIHFLLLGLTTSFEYNHHTSSIHYNIYIYNLVCYLGLIAFEFIIVYNHCLIDSDYIL